MVPVISHTGSPCLFIGTAAQMGKQTSPLGRIMA